MKKSLLGILFSFLLIAAVAYSRAPAETAEIPAPEPELTPEPVDAGVREGWELVWQDEFDAGELDRNSWTFDLGAGGWGNNELQFYTDRPENVRLEDGYLIVEARQEAYRGSNYTSGRIKTQGLQEWAYGRIEARIQLPSGQGVWSAFWMLGNDFLSVGWPESGEIDIMENIGDPDAVYGTIHGPGYSGGDGIGGSYVNSNLDLSSDFHVFAIEWQPGEIAWFVDDIQYNRITFDQVPRDWVYDHPFFIILNMAIGGNWPGYPDESTIFPQVMKVDYVRVYRDPSLVLEKKADIHVQEILVELQQSDGRQEMLATVVVVDQDGNPVREANVGVGWLRVVTGADVSNMTDGNGKAGPYRAFLAPAASEFSFCVVNVSHPLFSYDKSANKQTCVFVEP